MPYQRRDLRTFSPGYLRAEPGVKSSFDFQFDVWSDFAFDFVVYPDGNANIVEHPNPAEDFPREQVGGNCDIDDSGIEQCLFNWGQVTLGEGVVEKKQFPGNIASEFFGICDDFTPGVLGESFPVNIFESDGELVHRFVQYCEDKNKNTDGCNHNVSFIC